MSKNILIIKLGAFGDLLAIEGAIRDIKKNHENDTVYFLTSPAYKKIMDFCPWIDKVLIHERKSRWRIDYLLKLKKTIKNKNIDMVYDLQNSYRTDFYHKYLFSKLKWSGTAKNSTYFIDRNGYNNNLIRLEKQLSLAGVNTEFTSKPSWDWLCKSEKEIIEKHDINKEYIILLFGSSKGNKDKRWPYYKELCEELIKLNKRVICVPGPDELDEGSNISARMLLNNGMPLNFFEMACVLKNASFVIGNDSGPTYLAAFLNTSGIVIIGNHETNMIPYLEKSNFSFIKSENISNIKVNDLLNKFIQQ